MNKRDIDTMTGKELGIALAKEVMGWQECDPHKIEAAGTDVEANEACYPCWRDMGLSRLMVFFIADTVEGTSRYWAPWESIADAWEVLRHIGQNMGPHSFSMRHKFIEAIKELLPGAMPPDMRSSPYQMDHLWALLFFADFCPLVCRAALKAVT